MNIIIGGVYIPPASQLAVYQECCETVEELSSTYESSNFLICGDFNRPEVEWDQETYIPKSGLKISEESMCIIESFEVLGFQQINKLSNSKGIFLDLFFTNLKDVQINFAHDPLNDATIHHETYILKLHYPILLDEVKTFKKIYNFNSSNLENLNNYYSSIGWDNLLLCHNIDEMIDTFYKTIFDGIDQLVPYKLVYVNNNKYPKWFNKELIYAIKKKKIAHARYAQTGEANDYTTFSVLRSTCKTLSKQLYNDYIQDVQVSLNANPKLFWSYLKEVKKDSSIPSHMTLGEIAASGGEEIVNLMASHFETSYVNEVNTIGNQCSDVFSVASDVCDIVLSKEKLFNLLLSLKDNNYSGPDNLSCTFLKNCKYSLCCPIYTIFHRSLTEGRFPTKWKLSYIKPIFKAGNKTNIENYRGVCQQSILPNFLINC